MIFYQLFEKESSTFTYLLADEASRHAVIIDPVLECHERDLKLINELNLELTHILETHLHADHITGAHKLRKATGALITLSEAAEVEGADKRLKDGEIIKFGLYQVKALATPGHTDSCMSYLVGNKIFTGDSILVRATGRTDFQQGDAKKLYHSIHKKIFTLPEDTEIYPAHDYSGIPKTTVGLEKKHNPRIGGSKTEAEFIKIMSELKLAYPKKLTWLYRPTGNAEKRMFKFEINNGIPEVNPANLQDYLGKVRLIDVRNPDEFAGELGHVPGSELITMGPELQAFLEGGNREEALVFVCRSGSRSARATMYAHQLGYENSYNLKGGMILWNEFKLPVNR